MLSCSLPLPEDELRRPSVGTRQLQILGSGTDESAGSRLRGDNVVHSVGHLTTNARDEGRLGGHLRVNNSFLVHLYGAGVILANEYGAARLGRVGKAVRVRYVG